MKAGLQKSVLALSLYFRLLHDTCRTCMHWFGPFSRTLAELCGKWMESRHTGVDRIDAVCSPPCTVIVRIEAHSIDVATQFVELC